MRFAQTETQEALADATRLVLKRESPAALVREACSTGVTPAAYWAALGDLGLLRLLAPEELGGGGTELDLFSALVELGEAAGAGPVVETSAVAVPLAARFAPELLKEDHWLMGGVTATDSVQVPYAASGECLLLRGDELQLLTLRGLQVADCLDRSRAVATLETRHLVEARTLAAGPEVREEIQRASDRAAAATAAVLVGLSRRALQMTVEYTGVRRQFGVPIGSFQAVKHHVANAHIAIEMAAPLIDAAGWALAEHDPRGGELSSMAKVMANKAGRVAAKAALQCHGAIGYTTECDLHLYLLRIWSLLNAWGGTGEHVDRVAARLNPQVLRRPGESSSTADPTAPDRSWTPEAG